MKIFSLMILLSAFSSLTLMEVVQKFNTPECSKFFIKPPNKNVITPTVLEGHQYKKICQRWKNVYRFATLFDTKRRIPVYSAYTYSDREEDKQRNAVWKNEPQLENPKDMMEIADIDMYMFLNQAVNRDYTDYNNNRKNQVNYTRGHVYPNQYAADQDQADSTFTFTNIAPQTEHSNGEWEKHVETPMKIQIKKVCNFANGNLAYIVTGVVPGNTWIPINRKKENQDEEIKEGINIPIHYWTAFCCVSNNNTIFSSAYLAQQNLPPGKTSVVRIVTVNKLNRNLKEFYKITEFKVFGDFCLV